MARAKLNPTEAQRLQVRQLAGCGLTHEQIRVVMNLPSVTTLCRYFRKDLEKGRITAGAKIRGVAYKMATSGKNPIMTMFWLKTRAKWSNEMRLEDVSTRRSRYEPIDWILHRLRPDRPADTIDADWGAGTASTDDPWEAIND